ncbi:MAG: hypothetical protein GY799_28315 [Desulfobulbaceae bacterium]|nr:hypothetical protein [Desulfobulbaceae bacterium]
MKSDFLQILPSATGQEVVDENKPAVSSGATGGGPSSSSRLLLLPDYAVHNLTVRWSLLGLV